MKNNHRNKMCKPDKNKSDQVRCKIINESKDNGQISYVNQSVTQNPQNLQIKTKHGSKMGEQQGYKERKKISK